MEDDKKQYVKTKDLFSYAIGLGGQNISYGYISGWLFYYMTTILNIKPVVVGVITSISRIWDSINDPIVGSLVDKHRFKNGEKLRPILLYTPVIVGLLACGMFLPYKLSMNATIAIICVLYLCWDLFYSFQDTALWGMLAMSSPHSHERARVSQWVSIGAGAGGTIAGFFQIMRSVATNTFGMSDVAVFMTFGLLFGLGGELISLFAYKMHENVETPKSNESIIEAIFVVRHNKKLLLISVARFFRDVTMSLLPVVYFFESKKSYNFGIVELDGGTTQVVYTVLTGLIGAVAMFFVNKIANKIGGMKRILVIAVVADIFTRVVAYFIGFNSTWQIYLVMIIVSIAAIPRNMMDIAHRSLTTDSIDEVEYKVGKRTEGISFSIQNFTTKIAQAVQLFINGIILQKLNYNSELPNYEQGELYQKWIWPIFMLGPIIGLVLYYIAIHFVEDDKDKRAMIEQELKRRREAVESEIA